jgi:hypothetical protein
MREGARALRTIPLQRGPPPEDIAGPTVLCSDLARTLRGFFNVNGVAYLWLIRDIEREVRGRAGTQHERVRPRRMTAPTSHLSPPTLTHPEQGADVIQIVFTGGTIPCTATPGRGNVLRPRWQCWSRAPGLKELVRPYRRLGPLSRCHMGARSCATTSVRRSGSSGQGIVVTMAPMAPRKPGPCWPRLFRDVPICLTGASGPPATGWTAPAI